MLRTPDAAVAKHNPSSQATSSVLSWATRNRPPEPGADFRFRHRRRPFATCALATQEACVGSDPGDRLTMNRLVADEVRAR
jgi:hypothetical protein